MIQQTGMTPDQYAAMEPEGVSRIMQIIAAALIMSVIFFGGVVALLWEQNQPAPAAPARIVDQPMILLAIVLTFLMLAARFTLPAIVTNYMVAGVIKMYQTGALSGTKEFFGRLMAIAQMRMILEYAMVEGICTLNLVATMMTHSFLPVGITIAMILMMVLMFPTRDKLLNWLEAQRNKMADV
ncbi:MAG: hypothetical protein WD065_12665 [Planctomycetaceae bacterium]